MCALLRRREARRAAGRRVVLVRTSAGKEKDARSTIIQLSTLSLSLRCVDDGHRPGITYISILESGGPGRAGGLLCGSPGHAHRLSPYYLLPGTWCVHKMCTQTQTYNVV